MNDHIRGCYWRDSPQIVSTSHCTCDMLRRAWRERDRLELQVIDLIRERELRKRRRSHRSDEDYQEVAEIYRRAQADGAPVQRTVADALHVGTAHAARLIGEARRRGFLPPTTKGKAKA